MVQISKPFLPKVSTTTALGLVHFAIQKFTLYEIYYFFHHFYNHQAHLYLLLLALMTKAEFVLQSLTGEEISTLIKERGTIFHIIVSCIYGQLP